MMHRGNFDLPSDKAASLRRAVRLEWISIGFLVSIVLVMYLTMGSSQAMKAAWLEDLLSIVPPVSFLIAARVSGKRANDRFPYGYRRVVSIGFLCAALALTVMGSYLVLDAISKLVHQEHPTVGSIVIFGRTFWHGWLMIVALIYSVIPPLILGAMKRPLAEKIHDKTLLADADMNKADWLTGLAGIGGVMGIGMGWWWADAAAAGLIGFDILRDGLSNLSRVVFDLMDQAPTRADGSGFDQLPIVAAQVVRALPWVRDAEVRMREEGHTYVGEIFIVPHPGEPANAASALAEAERVVRELDWKMFDLVATLRHEGDLHSSDGTSHEEGLSVQA